MKPLCLPAALVLVLAAVLPSQGAVITTYNSFAAWQSAVDQTPLSVISFNNVSTGVAAQLSSYSEQGVTFTGSGGGASGLYWLNQVSFGGTVLMSYPGTGGTQGLLNVALPAGVNAMKIDLSVRGGGSGTNITAYVGGQSYTVPVTIAPTSTFFGLTSTGDLGTVRFGIPNDYVIIDNVQFGSVQASVQQSAGPSAVPEVATMFLCASGLVFLGVSRRGRIKAYTILAAASSRNHVTFRPSRAKS